jgi:hypothetical protein
MKLKLDKCPEGSETCKTKNCIYQQGELKGNDIPSLYIDNNDDNAEYIVTCQQKTEI